MKGKSAKFSVGSILHSFFMVSKKLDLELNGDGVAGLFDSLDEERVAAGRGVEALQPGLGVPATTGLQAGRFADVVP